MLTEHDLLRVADAYALAEGISDKTVSSRVFADSKKLAAIRAGNTITVKRLNAAFWWFSANWPENAAWPEGLFRPFPAEAAE